jgi:hypothetical protein
VREKRGRAAACTRAAHCGTECRDASQASAARQQDQRSCLVCGERCGPLPETAGHSASSTATAGSSSPVLLELDLNNRRKGRRKYDAQRSHTRPVTRSQHAEKHRHEERRPLAGRRWGRWPQRASELRMPVRVTAAESRLGRARGGEQLAIGALCVSHLQVRRVQGGVQEGPPRPLGGLDARTRRFRVKEPPVVHHQAQARLRVRGLGARRRRPDAGESRCKSTVGDRGGPVDTR